MKILVIEDDKSTVEVLKLTLEYHDPDCVFKATERGREGLESIKKESFDVVVLDLGLPDIDGMKVLQELRGVSKTPVVVISARHEPEMINNALGLGARDYILKPFSLDTFLSTLKDITLHPYSPTIENLN